MSVEFESAARIASLKAGIEAKTGKLHADLTEAVQALADMAKAPAVSTKDVNFFDYDGTLLYSFTLEEAQDLTALPALPSREGLICQKWNYDLDTIKSYNRAVNIGATYITDDGTTRIYIRLEDGRTSPMLGVCPNGTVDVDWGDGTAHDTLTGTDTTVGQWTPTHEYAEPGDYVIRLTVDGEMGFYGSSASNHYAGILRYSSGADARNTVYQNAVQKVEIGDGVTSIGSSAFNNCRSLSNIVIPDKVASIGSYAFNNCYSLANIVIPDKVASIGSYAFYSCFSLSNIVIPDKVASIGIYAFRSCYSLASIVIPDKVASIGSTAFNSCSSLSNIVIPDKVASIGSYAFAYCYGMRYYDFTKHTTVPTLTDTTVFTNIPDDCEIRVPAALAEEWKAATNWATYADYIVGVAKIYGVEWDYSQSSTKLTRLNDAADFADPAPAASLTAVGSSPFDDIMPWAGMKKYNIIDGAVSFSEDDDGFDMAAHDTMVYIPPFYYKAEKDEANQKWRWYISPEAQAGFALHPGSGRYIGRYHTSDNYTSVSGIAPLASITRATGRTSSHAKGEHWWQMDFATWCALELLYLVEFADWDSQTTLGTGNNSGTKVNTGGTDGAAYHTVKLSGASNQYRSIENPYSNLLTWCDGYVASARAVYAGLDNGTFGDTTANLTATGITLPSTNACIAGYGYCEEYPWAFIPDTSAGTDYTKYVSDRVNSRGEVHVLYVGGDYTAYTGVGLFCTTAYYYASTATESIGSRLIYIPEAGV